MVDGKTQRTPPLGVSGMRQDDLFMPDLIDAVIELLAQQWRAASKLAFEHLRRSFGQTTRFDHFERRFLIKEKHT